MIRRIFMSTAGLLLAVALNAISLAGAATVTPDPLPEVRKLITEGAYPAALERLDKHLTEHPTDPAARFLKGVVLSSQNQSGEAIQVFLALIRDNPELPEPHNNLAVLYAAQGKYDDARSELELAIQASPGYATAHENLGDLYANMASRSYAKAAQFDKGNASAKRKLVLIKELFSAGNKAPNTSGAKENAEHAPLGAASDTRDGALAARQPYLNAKEMR
jgi:Flp pilus assembly protein TadD